MTNSVKCEQCNCRKDASYVMSITDNLLRCGDTKLVFFSSLFKWSDIYASPWSRSQPFDHS